MNRTLVVLLTIMCVASATASANDTISISYPEFYAEFVKPLPKNLTSAQQQSVNQERAKKWRNFFQNKRVRWTGRVNDVRIERHLGTIVAISILDEGTRRKDGVYASRDVDLYISPASAAKAATLNKGQICTFTGKLTQQPWWGITITRLEEATIIKP